MEGEVVVVGGGPAGLLAAGTAAEKGARVRVLEKSPSCARKLRLTGGGRGNLTNLDPVEEFITRFGANGRFLRQAFSRFFSAELRDFFARIGVPTAADEAGRVFAASGLAADAAAALEKWVRGRGVEIITSCPVRRLVFSGSRVVGIEVGDASVLFPTHPVKAVIIATGGMSYPRTGSTGDGYRLAAAGGHRIVSPRAALVPLETVGGGGRLQGISLRNTPVRVISGGRAKARKRGDLLFTASGLSGPVILSLSGLVVDELASGARVEVALDLVPDREERELDEDLARIFKSRPRRLPAGGLKEIMPGRLAALCVELAGIEADRAAGQVPAVQRRRLSGLLKNFRREATGAHPLAEAMVTAGGVDLKEVGPRTMASRLVCGLYFAGEVLDLAGDTGGYNLQAAFSTGWLAGREV